MSCEEYFVERLRQQGYRLTPQRETVLSVLHQMDDMTTAEDIYDRVHIKFKSLDLSTVYRTLDLLVDLGLVVVLDTGEGQRRYELVGVHGMHHHLHCRVCGNVTPADKEAVQPMIDALRQQYGFVAQPGSLTITGLCEECAEKQ